jgi:hypothetical protein
MPIELSKTLGDTGSQLVQSSAYVSVFTNPIYVGLLIAIIIVLIAMCVYVDDTPSSLVKFIVYSCLISVTIQNLHSGALRKVGNNTEEKQNMREQLDRLANPNNLGIVGQGEVRGQINRDDFMIDSSEETSQWAW